MNYKVPQQSLEFGSMSKVLPNDIEIIILTAPSTSIATGLTYHDTRDNTDYKSPSTKKFYILGIHYVKGTSTRTISIYQGSDVDGTAGEADKLVYLDNIQDNMDFFFFHKVSIGLSKYLNFKTDNASGTGTPTTIYGYEAT